MSLTEEYHEKLIAELSKESSKTDLGDNNTCFTYSAENTCFRAANSLNGVITDLDLLSRSTDTNDTYSRYQMFTLVSRLRSIMRFLQCKSEIIIDTSLYNHSDLPF